MPVRDVRLGTEIDLRCGPFADAGWPVTADAGESVGGHRYDTNMRSSEGGSAVGADGTDRGDAVLADLSGVLDRLSAHTAATATDPGVVSDAVRIDRIAVLERLRGAVAAAQNAETVAFARSQVEEQIARGDLDPAKVGRGVADQVALACKISPSAGSRRLNIARALYFELPGVGDLLRRGLISEDVAGRVVSETQHLDPELRRVVDARLVEAGLDQLSPAKAAATAKRLAYEADPAGYVGRGRTARKDRRVGLRPAPDTMAVLSAFVPVEQGVACYAALRKRADALVAAGDARSRDQIMVDTLVERVTGQATATEVDVEVGIVIDVDALLDPDAGGTAEVVGHGPVPAGIAADILATTTGRRLWRRLFARPKGGPVVGADRRGRFFDGLLAYVLRVRDGDRCRDPYCDAAGRHLDHIHSARAGGPKSLSNGRVTCVRGNLVKEMPGWTVEVVEDGLGEEPHTVRTTTPTGHTYTSRAGPAP